MIRREKSSAKTMKTIYTVMLTAGLGLAAIQSCFGASSTINFAGSFGAREEQGTAIIEVHRTGDTGSTASIDYVTIEGTAILTI